MPDPNDITLAQILVVGGAATAALALISKGVRRLIPFLRKLLKLVDALTALLGDHDKGIKPLPDLVQDIHRQVFNNGGGSLKDSVDRVETAQTIMTGHVADLQAGQHQLAASQVQQASATEALTEMLDSLATQFYDHLSKQPPKEKP